MTLKNKAGIFLRSSVLALAIATAGAAASAQGIKLMEPAAAIEAGRDALGNEDYIRAANIFEQAVLAHPQDQALNRFLGIGYYKSGRNEAAIRQLQRASTLAPEDAESHYALGVVYLARAGEVGVMKVRAVLKDSIDHLQNAIDLNPDHASAHYYLIQVLINAPKIAGGDLERARTLNQHLAEISPLHHQVVNGTLAAKDKDWEAAEKILLDALEQHGDSSLVNFALLSHYAEREQYGKAIPFGEKFLSLPKTWDDSDLAGAHFLLAKAHRHEGNQQQSLQHYAETLTHTENNNLVKQVQEAVAEMAAENEKRAGNDTQGRS
ncbi:tetratricopeptide repeat protein [Proteobacteria bacterium 005FR1]|nr:tetratricopeptide repeat protein [Proteobacteria bacterium 005FR1]